MAGFFDGILAVVNKILGFVFGWSISISPYFAIFLVTLVTTALSTLIYKYTSDQIRLKEIKNEMNELKRKMKDSKGDIVKFKEHNSKMTELSMETMKHSIFNFKYMIISLVPLAIIFNWARGEFAPMNIWGSQWGWFWIYIIFSFIISSVLRKVLKVY